MEIDKYTQLRLVPTYLNIEGLKACPNEPLMRPKVFNQTSQQQDDQGHIITKRKYRII